MFLCLINSSNSLFVLILQIPLADLRSSRMLRGVPLVTYVSGQLLSPTFKFPAVKEELRNAWPLEDLLEQSVTGHLVKMFSLFVYLKETLYLLTPWCRVLLEKLTGLQLVKKFPAFYGTRRFITALKSVRHLSLSWASPIQSIYPHPTSWRSILILYTHLRLGLPSGSFPPVTYLLT